MAAVSDLFLTSEHVQRLLQCAVCLETFKRPKLLPCQHTFCLSPCLEGLVDVRTRSVRCPQCRADHFVPRNGPNAFPNNLTIIGFLELSSPQTPARDNIGADAVPGHDRVTPAPAARDPSGNPAGVEPNLGFLEDDILGGEPGGAFSCSVCRDETSISRCVHCDQLVCDECRRAHVAQVRSDVIRMVGQIRRSLPQITDQIASIARREAQLQTRCEGVKSDISEAFEKHVRDLKARERVLLEEVDVFAYREIRNLRVYQETTEMETASLVSFCDSAETQLSLSRAFTDGDLVEMKRQCLEHLETVQCYEDGITRPPNSWQIQASMESPFMSSTISNFGELITSRQATSISDARPSITTAETRTSSQTNEELRRSEEEVTTNLRMSRASMPPQVGRPMDRLVSALRQDVRAESISPTRRRRSRQVNFDTDEDSPMPEPSLDSSLGMNRRGPNRWTRQERRSDSRLNGLESSRSTSLPRQAQTRARHRSLGAPTSLGDYLDERHEDQGSTADLDRFDMYPTRTHRSRPYRSEFDEDQEDTGIDDGELVERRPTADPDPSILSSTYPGARTQAFLPPSLQHNTESTLQTESASTQGGAEAQTFGNNSNTASVYVTTPRNMYNQKGRSVCSFGRRGSGAGELTCPRGVAASLLDDRVYVADSSNHRVQIFTSTGRLVKTFGRHGMGEGEFDCLAGIAVNGLGQVIIVDRYNHRVQIFDRNGNFQSAFGTEGHNPGQLNYPWGVACDNMGFIYVCDKENNRVQVFQSNGAYVRMFGCSGSLPGQFINPHYIAVSPDNKIYVSDSSNHRIQVFSIYGDYIFSFGSCGNLRGQMKFPRGIAIDNQGFVVVADSGNNRVQIFRSDGRFYSMFGGWGSDGCRFKGLEGLTILADGKIVIGDRENHCVQIF